VPERLTLGLGPPSGVSIGRLSGVGALWDCVSRVCGGGGGCAGGGVPLGAGPCCPDVGRCLSGVNIIIITGSRRIATEEKGNLYYYSHQLLYTLRDSLFRTCGGGMTFCTLLTLANIFLLAALTSHA